MSAKEPELDTAAAALAAEEAAFVVIGGFAVIANRFVRATEDIDLLVPDDEENDRRLLAALGRLKAVRHHDGVELKSEHLRGQAHLRVDSNAGMIDLVRGGAPPLDFDTIRSEAMIADYDGLTVPVASLRSVVGLKRLSGRPHDRNDLENLEGIHGKLPTDPIPGLDE